MNKSLPILKSGLSRARFGWRVCTTIMLVAGLLLSVPAATRATPLPPDVGIQGTVNHACPDVYELDDAQNQAKTLTAGGAGQQSHTVDGNLATGIADKDWVKFQVKSGDTYTVTATITPITSLADPAIKLYDSLGNAVLNNGVAVENDDAGGALGKGSRIVWKAPATASGDYYAMVYASPNQTMVHDDCASTVVRYTLSLEVPAGPSGGILYLPLIRR